MSRWRRTVAAAGLAQAQLRSARTLLDLAEIGRRATARVYPWVAGLELPHVGSHVTIGGGVRFEGTRRVHLGQEAIVDPGTTMTTRNAGEIIVEGRCYIAPNTFIFSTTRVQIGLDVLIAANCLLSTRTAPLVGHVGAAGGADADIVLRSGCWLASNVVVGPGVTIGEGAVVGANAVVVDDVPPRSLAVGAPAHVVRSF
jgi:acetyltransferase-like isoleucine patch superfamily enzyme